MKEKHVECVSLKETFFSRASQLFEIWAMYHLNLLENDESIGIDRCTLEVLHPKTLLSGNKRRSVYSKRIDAKETTRKRQREQIEEELRESREKKRLQKREKKLNKNGIKEQWKSKGRNRRMLNFKMRM